MGKRKTKMQQETAPVVEEVEETTMTANESTTKMAQAQDVNLDNEALFDSADESTPDSTNMESDEDLELEASDENADANEGTKERKKRGKRQIIFDCAGVVTLVEDDSDQNLKAGERGLVLEEMAVSMPAEDQTFDPARGRAEAIELFTTKYGVKPSKVRGPYYIRKGIATQVRKRETINQTIAKEIEFTTERGSAVHRFKELDWKVMVHFTTKPDTVWIFYDTLVDPKQAPKDKNKLQKPTPKFLKITSLRDVSRNA